MQKFTHTSEYVHVHLYEENCTTVISQVGFTIPTMLTVWILQKEVLKYSVQSAEKVLDAIPTN